MKLSFLLSLISLMGLLASCNQKPETPRPDHIIVVMEENHGYDELVGSSNAPFINKLAQESAIFTDSHGVTHPSQPNYLALYSGSTQGVTGDDCLDKVSPYTTPNLGASLIKKGLTFKGYGQTMPSAGFLGCEYIKSSLTDLFLYARKHAPWVNWIGKGENNIPAAVSLPLTAFPKDFSKLPTVAFVIPDMDNDMHNIGKPGDAAAIQRGDQWLKDNLEAYVKWAKTHNSLLVVTFDEDDFKPVNHIPTIFSGANIKTGQYDQKINHYNVLHTIESMYDLPVQDSTKAEIITGIWSK